MIKEQKRNERGITLVALTVTLVVLLILAGITIATLFGDNGVINKAQKAKEETEKAEKYEIAGINEIEKNMNSTISQNKWEQNEDGTITDGEITLKIGDYVNYDCTTSNATYTSPKEKTGHTADQVFKAKEYQYGWRVLGVSDNKELLVISEDFVQPNEGGTTLGVRKAYTLRGKDGYINGVEELSKICNLYGNGNGAKKARCVNIDDINKITGYNPNNIGKRDPSQLVNNGEKSFKGEIYEYGNSVEYTLTADGVKYESKGNDAEGGVNKTYKNFTYYDEKEKKLKKLNIDEKITLKSSAYYYYPTTLTESGYTDATTGISIRSVEYKMLFTNSSTGVNTGSPGQNSNFRYWLSSTFIRTSPACIGVGLREVRDGFVDYMELYYSAEGLHEIGFGIRPVIYINNNVQLKYTNTQKDGCNLYEIIT